MGPEGEVARARTSLACPAKVELSRKGEGGAIAKAAGVDCWRRKRGRVRCFVLMSMPKGAKALCTRVSKTSAASYIQTSR